MLFRASPKSEKGCLIGGKSDRVTFMKSKAQLYGMCNIGMDGLNRCDEKLLVV